MAIRQISLQRWSITSQKPFESVVASVEAAISKPNMSDFGRKMASATTYAEMVGIVQDAVSEIGLMEFLRLDAGAVLAKGLSTATRKAFV